MSGANFHHGAPLPVPFTKEVCEVGQDRLMRIQDVCECPVGVENLALALRPDDVKIHGEFLNELITPINGFIILDLHNIYCQLHNFNMEIDGILSCYPLDKVREIHISGGSWEPSGVNPLKRIRRDTHDNGVPDKVFELLSYVIDRCPNLRYVILEQLGRGLLTNESKKQFQQDFYKMSEIVEKASKVAKGKLNSFLPSNKKILLTQPLENTSLHLQQQELSEILENSIGVEDARAKFLNSKPLVLSDWRIEYWQDDMLETAIKVAKKWKDGF
jgi:hypothetical protein